MGATRAGGVTEAPKHPVSLPGAHTAPAPHDQAPLSRNMWVYRAFTLWIVWTSAVIFCATAPWYAKSVVVMITFSVIGALECLLALYVSILYARPGLLPGAALLAPNLRARSLMLREGWCLLTLGVVCIVLSIFLFRGIHITFLPVALCWTAGAAVLLAVVYGNREAPQPLAHDIP